MSRRNEQAGRRARRIVRLTARGRRALDTWLTRRPAWPAPLRDEFLIRLLAAEPGGPTAILSQLERHEAECHRYATLVREQAPPPDATATRHLAHQAALAHAEAQLLWLARCRVLFDTGTLARAS